MLFRNFDRKSVTAKKMQKSESLQKAEYNFQKKKEDGVYLKNVPKNGISILKNVLITLLLYFGLFRKCSLFLSIIFRQMKNRFFPDPVPFLTPISN